MKDIIHLHHQYTGVSTSGKSTGFDPVIRGFESLYSNQGFISQPYSIFRDRLDYWYGGCTPYRWSNHLLIILLDIFDMAIAVSVKYIKAPSRKRDHR